MKVVLLADIPGVGRKGEAKEVSDGYYRNFLVPKRLAAPPTDLAATRLSAELGAKKAQQLAELEQLRQTAAKFNGRTVTVAAKAHGDKLFGAVHEVDIAKELGVDKKLIKMSPIRQLGLHQVPLDFGHGIKATIAVEVKAA